MSTEPQRYDLENTGMQVDAYMLGTDSGDYVLFSDWEALRIDRDSQIVFMGAQVEALVKEINRLRADRDSKQ